MLLAGCKGSSSKTEETADTTVTEVADPIVSPDFVDLTMEDPKGQTVSISQYVGKQPMLLVDFWASWCGPCRQEMPNVKVAYEKFHEKGLEILGVSLDQDRDAWLGALERMEMDWPQMSDLKGWESAAVAAYNVTGIPSNVLFDEEGNILDRDLRGEHLQEVLELYLGSE